MGATLQILARRPDWRKCTFRVIRVRSPAPPFVVLLGLVGMVLGEQAGIWMRTKNLDVPRAAAMCLVGESYHSAASTENSLMVV
jgi:XapX domain-containing protein